MLGLCHVCFTSNTEVQITKGLVHCVNCKDIDARPLQEKEKEEVKLPFEDLPSISEEERTALIKPIIVDIFEVIYHKEMNRERVNEVI